MLTNLSSDKWQVRRSAARALGQIGQGHPLVVDALLKCFSDTEWRVSQAAIGALGQLGQRSPLVINALLEILFNTQDNVLLKCLVDSHWYIRRIAARMLARFGQGHSQMPNALLNYLSDSKVSVKLAALEALDQLRIYRGLPLVTNALLKCLFDPDTEVRQKATLILAQDSTKPEVFDTLLKQFTDTHTKLAILEVFWQILEQEDCEYTQVIKTLLECLSDLDIEVQQKATLILEQTCSRTQVLNTLLNLFTAGDIHTKLTVLEVLGLERVYQQHSQVIEILLKYLLDPNVEVQQKAMLILQEASMKPQTLDALLRLFTVGDTQMRLAIIKSLSKALGRQDNSQFTEIFLLINPFDSDEEIRRKATQIQAQASKNQPAIISTILNYLSHASSDVKLATLLVLEWIDQERFGDLDIFIQYFSQTNIYRKRTTVTVQDQKLLSEKHVEIVGTLLKHLTNTNTRVKLVAINILKSMNLEQIQVVDALIKRLSDADADVKLAAIQALSKLGNKHPWIVEALLKPLSHSNPLTRQAAVQVLAQISTVSPEVIGALLRRISDSDVDVRDTTVHTVEQMSRNTPQFVDICLEYLSDPNWRTRLVAIQVLGYIDQKQSPVIEPLLKCLSDSSRTVRQATLETLVRIGSANPKMIDALSKRLYSFDWSIRDVVRDILKRARVETTEYTKTLNAIPRIVYGFNRNTDYFSHHLMPPTSKYVFSHKSLYFTPLFFNGFYPFYINKTSFKVLPDYEFDLPFIFQTPWSDWLAKTLLDPDEFWNFPMSNNWRWQLSNYTNKDWRRQLLMFFCEQYSFESEIYQHKTFVIKGLLRLICVPNSNTSTDLSMSTGPNSNIREVAVRSLGQLSDGSSDILDALLICLYDPNFSVRQGAAWALEQAGVERADILDALLDSLSDSHPNVRLASARALAKLSVDRDSVASSIDHLLEKYEQTLTNQLSADDMSDTMLLALQLITNGF